MKIDENDQIMKNVYPEGTAKSRLTGKKAFGTILEESLAKAPKTAGDASPAAFVNPLPGARMIAPSPPDPTVTIEPLEKMIDLLDQYRQKLADPQISLKQIDATVGKIVRQNDSLAILAKSLPADDEIKTVLNRTRVTAALEVTKFYRGDYLP